MADVARENGAILAVGIKQRFIEKAANGEGRVKYRRRMSFAEDETVPIRIGRIGGVDSQHARVEHGENVSHGETTADVRGLRSKNHAECMGANASRKVCRIRHFAERHTIQPYCEVQATEEREASTLAQEDGQR